MFGPSFSIQIDGGGEWKNELCAELRSERRIRVLYRGVGAHPWVLGRRNGLTRGIYNRLKGGDRFSGKQILAGAQWRLSTLIAGGGPPANRMVFGSDPVDPYRWEDKDGDLTFAQDGAGGSPAGDCRRRC